MAGVKKKKNVLKKQSLGEKVIQKEILTLLTIKQIPHARINSGMIYTGKYMVRLAPEGFPDIIFFHRGLHGVEVKREGKEPTPPQLAWKKIFLQNGAGWMCATSVDQVNTYLNSL